MSVLIGVITGFIAVGSFCLGAWLGFKVGFNGVHPGMVFEGKTPDVKLIDAVVRGSEEQRIRRLKNKSAGRQGE